MIRESRLRREFARSPPDKRACRSPSGECEPLFAPLARGGSHLSTKQRRRRTDVRHLLCLVDPRGIEPLSENLLIPLSPGAVRYLNFPSKAVNGQTSSLGSHFLRDRLNGEPSVHGLRSFDAQSEAAKLLGGTGGISAAALPLGSHCYSFIVSV